MTAVIQSPAVVNLREESLARNQSGHTVPNNATGFATNAPRLGRPSATIRANGANATVNASRVRYQRIVSGIANFGLPGRANMRLKSPDIVHGHSLARFFGTSCADRPADRTPMRPRVRPAKRI